MEEVTPRRRNKPVLAEVPREAMTAVVDPEKERADQLHAQLILTQQRLAESEMRRAEAVKTGQGRPRFDLEGNMVSVFTTLGFILSARALLGLVLLGAFALGLYAMNKGDIKSLVCLGIYGIITVPGLIYLELRKSLPK